MAKNKTNPNVFPVHASSLPTHQDCPRRWAAAHVKEVGEAYELAPKGIGSILGDRAHAGAARMLLAKQLNGSWDWQQAAEEQIEELRQIIRTSAITWDKLTREPGVAEKQLLNLLFEFNRGVMPTANAHLVELEMRAKWSEFIRIVGKMDYIEKIDRSWSIGDHKFSSMLSPYHSQLGCYSILLQAQPFFIEQEGEIKDLILNWIKRVGVRAKVQPEVVQIGYDLEACENAAGKQLDEIEKEVKEYRATGNPWAFNANPNSKFCTKASCRAFGTKWCDQWIDLGEDED